MSKLPGKQNLGYVTICCGRAFLSEEGYNLHSRNVDDHLENIWSDVLLKTLVVKINKLPASHPVLSTNKNRIASIKHRILIKHRSGKAHKRATKRCHLCGLLVYGGNIKRHIKNAHLKQSKHKCRWCPCAYGSRKAILLHISRSHRMEAQKLNWNGAAQNKYEKSLRNETNSQEGKSSEKSKKSVTNGRPALNNGSDNKVNLKSITEVHECIFCGKMFYSTNSFQHHLIVHIGDTPYKCEVCQEDFETTDDITQHIDLWHPDSLRFRCEWCPGLFYNTQQHLDNHLKFRHSGTAEDTPSDDENENVGDVDSDDVSQNGNPPMLDLGTKLKASEVLKLKSIIVRDGHKCPICGKVLKKLSYYRAHRLLHTDIFPFECSKCHRKFRTMSNRDSHQLSSHIEDGEFKCTLCCCQFSTEFGLKCHTGIYHKLEDGRGKRWKNGNRAIPKKIAINKKLEAKKSIATALKTSKGYQCRICGKVVLSTFAYKGHMLIHTNEKPHRCKLCPAKFRLVSTRDHHIKTNHVEDGNFECPFCPCKFDLQRGLRRHLFCYHSGKYSGVTTKKRRIRKALASPKEKSSESEQPEDFSDTQEIAEIVKSPTKVEKLKTRKKRRKIGSLNIHKEDLSHIESIEMENGTMCSLCGKILKNIACFKSHRLVHTDYFPYKCSKCSKKFRRQYDRDKHIRRKHTSQ